MIRDLTNSSRRDFLRTGFFGIGVGMGMPLVFEHSALAMAAQAYHDGKEPHPNRILVVVEMAGGNDGLNTVVPYRQDPYYKARPTIGQKPETLHKLTDEIGLHHAMLGMQKIWDGGHLTIVKIALKQSLAVQANLHAPVVFSDPNRFVRAGDPDQEPVYRGFLDNNSQ